MRSSPIAGALVLVWLLFNAGPPALAYGAPQPNAAEPTARAEAALLRTNASLLDRSASTGRVPATSVLPPISPELDAWLKAGLTTARKEKAPASRAADMHAMAASLRTGADLVLRNSATAPKNIAADVRQVLADPAFRTPAVSPPASKKIPSWLERILASFLQWWSTQLGRAFVAAARAPAIGNLVAFVLLAAAALALAFLVFRMTTLIVARRARTNPSSAAGTPLIAHADADETYNAARAAAQSGSYGAAIALLFQAALLALDRSGRVPYDSARTAGEYRRAVRRSVSGAASYFETIARAFTSVAYAQSPADASDWRAADDAYASMSVAAAERR